MYLCSVHPPSWLTDFILKDPPLLLEGSCQQLIERMLAGELIFVLEAERPAGDNVNKFPWPLRKLFWMFPTQSVVFYQLDDPLAVRSIYLSYPKRQSSPVLHSLIGFMQENAQLGKGLTAR